LKRCWAKLLSGKDYILLPPCLPHVSVPTCLSSMTVDAAEAIGTPRDKMVGVAKEMEIRTCYAHVQKAHSLLGIRIPRKDRVRNDRARYHGLRCGRVESFRRRKAYWCAGSVSVGCVGIGKRCERLLEVYW
jgi:hypothetical protein